LTSQKAHPLNQKRIVSSMARDFRASSNYARPFSVVGDRLLAHLALLQDRLFLAKFNSFKDMSCGRV
jgi:hypothetical protein